MYLRIIFCTELNLNIFISSKAVWQINFKNVFCRRLLIPLTMVNEYLITTDTIITTKKYVLKYQ